MKSYAEQTNYFDIFRKTYWGAFNSPPNSLPENFIENRNKFITEFDIVSCNYSRTNLQAIFGGDFYDHQETYRTRDKRLVVVVSPYDHEGTPDVASALGFYLYAPMYHPWANTFIAVFKTGIEYRKAVNAAKRIKRNGKA